MKRLSAIDAFRGLAVVLMIMHHTVDSWVEPVSRGTWFFAVLRHLGGIPAPAFLLLAGVSSALVGARERDKGVGTRTRLWAGIKRGLYILGVAFAFRVFVFFAGGNTTEYWRILFRVDVLNCIGASLAVVAAATSFAKTSRQSIAIAAVLAAIFGLGAPWMEHVHVTFPSEFIGNYLSGNGVMVLFPMFPWVAYMAIGYGIGEYIARLLKESKLAGSITLDHATRPFFAIGAVLFVGGWLLEFVPFRVFPQHDYWHASPLWVTMRLGVQLALLAGFAFWLRSDVAGKRAGFLQLLGRHSLLAYVFHIELVYGRPSSSMSQQTSLALTFVGVGVLVAVAGALAWGDEWWERRGKRVKTNAKGGIAPAQQSFDPSGV